MRPLLSPSSPTAKVPGRKALELDLGELYQPHAGQEVVHRAEAKVKVLQCGRRWGKGRCGYWEMMRRFLESWGRPVSNAVVPPFLAWVAVPSYPQARQVWTEVLSFTPSALLSLKNVRQDDMVAYLTGVEGRAWGQLEIKSTYDPASLQTVGLDFLWLSEAQDVSREAFERLLPTLRSPERLGYAFIEGIPPTYADHWFQRLYGMAQEGRPGYFAYHATTFDNPLLTDEQRREIEGDREVLTEAAWERMYLARFSELAGFFRNVDACVVGDLLPAPLPGARYVAGLDLGRKVDATVLNVLDARVRRTVAHERWDRGQGWVLQREGIARACREWGVERLGVDATGMGGDIFCEELVELGLPVEPFVITSSSREGLLNGLAVALERGSVGFPAVAPLLRELRAFQPRKLPGGGWRVEAAPGEHDDEVFALALGLMLCDASVPLAPFRGRRGLRYLPTQEEADAGGSPAYQRRRQERREKIARLLPTAEPVSRRREVL